MLKDRKNLIEDRIIKLKYLAANMYFSMLVTGNNSNSEYDTLITQIADLEFELNSINLLLYEGHK